MANFAGGSPWAMAKEIAEGYVTLTSITLRRMKDGEIRQLTTEIDKRLRGVRGMIVPLDDIQAIQQRNRQIQRLTSALHVARSHNQRRPAST